MANDDNYRDYWNPPPRARRTQRRRQPVPVVGDNVITQEELRELFRLQRQRDRYTRLWKSIRQRLLDGAEVEFGLRRAHIEERAIVSFSQHALEQLFGAEWVEEQRQRIPPKIEKRMVLEDGEVPDPLGE